MEQKLSNTHCLVDKTMNMCENYLTKPCSKSSGASSCRCRDASAITERALPGFQETL